MPNLAEGNYTAEFLLSEENGYRSRDNITLKTPENLKAGAVLGREITAATEASAAAAGNTGDGAMGAVTASAGAKEGTYVLTIIEPAANAGTFTVEDPDGIEIGNGTVAVAFSAGGIAFTLADGATDFVAGDRFTITVTAASFKYQAHDPAATDGTQDAVGILLSDIDASAADKAAAAITRDAEVKSGELIWKTGISAADKELGIAALAEAGILVR